MSTEKQIIQILQKTQEIRLNDLVEATGVSRQMVHRAVKNLVEKSIIEKIGSAPRTYYRIVRPVATASHDIGEEDSKFLQRHFLLVTELGNRLTGPDALAYWCQRQKLPIEKTAAEFIATRKKYLQYIQQNGLIDGLQKIKSTEGFDSIGLDEVYYLDFYAIERFGKTRLGTLLHLAKQGQNRKLMDEIVTLTKDRIKTLLIEKKIDAVGFIPPTIKRDIQFMKVLERKLNLPLPHVKLLKVTGEIIIPQKSLNKIEERISNAKASIMVNERAQYKNVLLIDDAIGSGATINETAIKLKTQLVAKKVIGVAITGSFKGFDVLQEV